jgi:excisionase family DNA binding protein
MADTPARRLYTVAEAALLLGIGRSTAYELVIRNDLPVVLIGSRRMISARVLESLLGEAPPPPCDVKRLAAGSL